MTINEEIKEILKEFNISIIDGLSYLIVLYHGYDPSFIPDILKQKVNRTKIVTEEGGTVRWNVPLFEEQITGFEWVTDWMKEFADINPDRRGVKSTAIGRMKKFFIRYPDIRKEEVVGATRMYFKNVSDPRYLKKSHKFIFDGMGAEKGSELKEWVDKYREYSSESNQRTSQEVTMR